MTRIRKRMKSKEKFTIEDMYEQINNGELSYEQCEVVLKDLVKTGILKETVTTSGSEYILRD